MTNVKQYPWAYLRGKKVEISEATISITTQAFNYGTGVFEGIRAYSSDDGLQLNIFRLEEHLQRLTTSARFLKILDLPSVIDLKTIIIDLIRANNCKEDCYIRPIVFKQSLLPGQGFGVKLSGVSASFSINMLPMPSKTSKASGIKCMISPWVRTPDNSIPSRAKICGGYVNSALALESAIAAGYDETIMLNNSGDITEASTSNVFFIKNNRIYTPSLTSHILPGITRDTIITLAKQMGLEVIEKRIILSEAFDADECFLCGTGIEIAPVIQLDSYRIGNGSLGKLTQTLMNNYFNIVRGKIDSTWLTLV
jgi:branched-chain amino acid aminotransferase